MIVFSESLYHLLPFQLKVSSNNLTNVCKLVFKVSRDEKNDSYFLEDNILGKWNYLTTLYLKLLKGCEVRICVEY